MKIEIKGIYSTALINFFIKKGYDVINLSEKQRKRFGINSEGNPDVKVGDLKDKSGIYIKGNFDDNFIKLLKDSFWDSLFYKKPSKDNDNLYYINFGYNSKRILDELRNEIVPTIDGHHVYRRFLSRIVDFSEIIIKNHGRIIDERDFREFIYDSLRESIFISRYHRKALTGILLKYKEVIKDVKIIDDRLYLETVRKIYGQGIYDGLKIPKEEGDYVISKYMEGNWYFIMEYYNKEGKLKGRYININTPLEISRAIIYNDLAIDIIDINGEKRFEDLDELEMLYNTGIITEKIYNYIKEFSEDLIKKI